MTLGPPPLRFLVLVVGGWTAMRVAMLVPDWSERAAPASVRFAQAEPISAPIAAAAPLPARLAGLPAAAALGIGRSAPATWLTVSAGAPLPVPTTTAAAPIPVLAVPARVRLGPLEVTAGGTGASRWSGSAWLLARRERGGPALAAGGTLGGSQAGARLLYRLNGDAARPLSLSARVAVPLRRQQGAEAAAGIEWRPFAAAPLHLLAERRQALGEEGRSAFALAVHGGGSASVRGGWRLDGYGQAGFVGLASRDPFVEGAVRISRRLGSVEIGGGAWGGAQPGAARLDAGPSLSVPLAGERLRLTADWRFRLAGEAAPGSGPAVTLSAGF